MTDKKKLDEAVSLNVTNNDGEMTSSTTIDAASTMDLVNMLKNAGIKSTMFNGPATLNASEQIDDHNCMTTSISAPNLRLIMNMLEPEFQAVGDLEAQVAELPAEMDDDHIVDPAPVEEPEFAEVPSDAVDATIDDEGNLSLVDDEIEEAEYDFRSHDVHPDEYAGIADRKPVQPDTKVVPARSGDNPIKSFHDYVEEARAKKVGDADVAEEKEITTESLLADFQALTEAMDLDTAKKLAKRESEAGYVQHVNQVGDNLYSVSDFANNKTVASYERGRPIGMTTESELDEYGQSRDSFNRKINQYGEPYYLNTDCGFASLEMIVNGTAEYFDASRGITVLEIDRNGKKGLNYITSSDDLKPGTPVTCITQTSTGQKFRPGRFIISFTGEQLANNYEQVAAELAKLGISPSKKLSVKTFD